MTNTSVVLGIATLGTPEALSDWDCATDAAGSAAISKGIMNFIGLSSRSVWYRPAKRVRPYSLSTKKLLFSEALYEKVPRLHQHLLSPFRVRSNAGHHQHPRHTGEQQPTVLQLFFSRLTRNKWQQPLTIRFQRRLNSFPHGQRFSCELGREGGEHATASRRIRVAHA